MLSLSALLSAAACACYSLDAAPHGPFVLTPDTCFAFHLSGSRAHAFSGQNLTVRLSVAATNTFLGFGANATLPTTVIIEHSLLPKSDAIDIAAFTAPIPVLCGPAIDAGDAMRLAFPDHVETEDSLAVAFGVSLEENNTAYLHEFGAPGNCMRVLRRIPTLDTVGVSVGECVAMVFGLALGAGVVGACIVFLMPHRMGEKGEKGGAGAGTCGTITRTMDLIDCFTPGSKAPGRPSAVSRRRRSGPPTGARS